MLKLLKPMILVLGASVMLSCQWFGGNDVSLKSASYTVEGTKIRGYYTNGQEFEVIYDAFALYESNLNFFDTITMDDNVGTASNSFRRSSKRISELSTREQEAFTIKRCVYEGAFEVYITSWAHETKMRSLTFLYEAEEVWEGNRRIADQPFAFIAEKTGLENVYTGGADAEDGIYDINILKFLISAYDPADSTVFGEFDITYNVVRTTETVWPDTTYVIDVTKNDTIHVN